MNETLLKFEYPQGLIREYRHWVVLLRPQQITLGALILGYKGSETAFSAIPIAAMQELHSVIQAIESSLKKAFNYNKINYLMLMMVDPHVHFHVLPRYESAVQFEGIEFTDPGWPAAPDLANNQGLSADYRASLVTFLQTIWKPDDNNSV